MCVSGGRGVRGGGGGLLLFHRASSVFGDRFGSLRCFDGSRSFRLFVFGWGEGV